MSPGEDSRHTRLSGRYWPTWDRRPYESSSQWLARIDSYTNPPPVKA